eukprot:g1020.t1
MDAFVDEIVREAGKRVGGNHEWSFSETVIGFYHAVNWQQSWLRGLLLGHLILLATILYTRRNLNAQIGFFLFICVAASGAERLNALLKNNWESFADQDYFDTRGVFMCAVYSAPLLLIGFVQLVSLLCETSRMLVHAKRAELRAKSLRRGKNTTAAPESKKAGVKLKKS